MPKRSRQKKGHQSDYTPDAFQKHAGSFMQALTSSGEKMLYILLAAGAVLVVLAWVLVSIRTGESEEILNELNRATKDGDMERIDALLSEHAGAPEAALPILDRANAAFQAAMLAEDAQMKASDFQQADRFYHMFMEKYPDHELVFVAHHGLGCTMEERGQQDEALSEFRRALNRAPENMKDKFSYDVGRLLKNLGRNDEARVFLTDAVKNYKVMVQHPRTGQVWPTEADSPIARALLPPDGDYQWRLNARQLLAELEDEDGREKVKDLLPEEPKPEEPAPEAEPDQADGEPAPSKVPQEESVEADPEPAPEAADTGGVQREETE